MSTPVTDPDEGNKSRAVLWGNGRLSPRLREGGDGGREREGDKFFSVRKGPPRHGADGPSQVPPPQEACGWSGVNDRADTRAAEAANATVAVRTCRGTCGAQSRIFLPAFAAEAVSNYGIVWPRPRSADHPDHAGFAMVQSAVFMSFRKG